MIGIRDILAIVEMRTKVVSMASLGIAACTVLAIRGFLDPVDWVLLVVATLLVDMGTTGFNTWFDFWNGTDSINWNREEEKVLVHNATDPRWAFLVSAACFLLALIPGGILASRHGPWVAAIGALCMVVGFCYTGGPLPVSRTPAGEFVAGGFLGAVLFLIALGISGVTLAAEAFLPALPLSLWIGGILAANNACDRIGDGLSGRRTFAVLAGPRGAALHASLWFPAGTLCLALLLPRNPAGLIPFLGACAFCAMTMASIVRKGYSHERKGPVMQAILKLFVVQALAEGLIILLPRLAGFILP